MSAEPERDPSAMDPVVEAAAAEWLVKHDRGLTPRDQDEFLQWLGASPAHRESFQRHRAMWTTFNALAQWRPEHSAEPNPDLLARPRRRKWLRFALPAALGVAAVLAFMVVRSSLSAPNEPMVFEASTYQQEVLPDGSVLDLNRGAHVVVQYSPAERRVVLVQGEAQFTVAKNPARPFVVRAGGVDVRAVGTAFNVKLAGANLEVLVTEGTVRVSQQTTTNPGSSASTAAPAPRVAELSAGHRTVIPVVPAAEPPVVLPASSTEIEHLLEWKPRLLDFDSVPLAEVVEIFNARNATRLIVGDEELRSLPIVASIRSDNVAGFVRLLEATMNVRAEHRPSGEIVLRRAK
jgi:transmembrane sensor